MTREPNGYLPKKRTTISIDRGVLTAVKVLLKEQGYRNLSEYTEMLYKREVK
jgi:hypothetical protein